MKIADKISFSILALAIVVTSIAGAVVLKVASNGLKKEIISHLQATARSREDHIETYLKFFKASVAQFSQSSTLTEFLKTPKDDPAWNGSYKRVMDRLRMARELNSAIYEFLLVDKSGKVVASSDPASIGQDKSTDLIFTRGRNEIFIKDAYYSDTYKIPMISVGAPVKDSNTGHILGVLVARAKMDDLNNIAMNPTGLGKTGETLVININGYMITPSRFLKDTFLKNKVEIDNFDSIMSLPPKDNGDLSVRTAPDYRGVMAMETNERIYGMPWMLITKMDVDEALLPLRRLQIIIGFVIIMAPVISWIMGRVIAKAITEPLLRLQEGAEVIAATGNLTYNLGTLSRDEVGQLSRAFDAMILEIKRKVISIHDLNREVAARKKAEESAIKSAAEWVATFDAMAEGVSIHSPDYSILDVNRALCTILGKSREELIGKKCYQVFHGTGAAPDGCPLEKSRLTIKTEHSELFEPYLGRWLSVSTSPIYGTDGKIMNFVHVIADITERKRLRDQLLQSETMAALGRFSAGAAHEIKNPLGIILGGVEYLQLKFRGADEESKETIKMVINAVLRTDAIINALTGIAGTSERKARKVDVKIIVNDIVILMGVKFKDSNIIFTAAFADEGLFVEADIDQLQYALRGILTNAADAMPGGGEVRIKVYREPPERPSQDGSKCVIEVTDNGEGIDGDVLPKIFEPFFTTRRDKKQVGLGLTVAKEFIRLNNGDIIITSERNKGTLVKLAFPLAA